jgi:hypothetical protein
LEEKVNNDKYFDTERVADIDRCKSIITTMISLQVPGRPALLAKLQNRTDGRCKCNKKINKNDHVGFVMPAQAIAKIHIFRTTHSLVT